MKPLLRLAPLGLALLSTLPAPLPAQATDPARDLRLSEQADEIRRRREERLGTHASAAPETEELDHRFDLDFPGGTPAELVAAIEKASGRPLNVIIPEDHARTRLPALRLHQVDVPKLFEALFEAMKRQEFRMSANFDTSGSETHTVFQTKDRPPTESSIWFFQVYGIRQVDRITRFFSLKPYLQSGLTVDDITTAIRTAWEMRGDTETPALKFHEETQLLIAVGPPEQLVTIRDVLKTLGDNITQPVGPASRAPAPTPTPPGGSGKPPAPAAPASP